MRQFITAFYCLLVAAVIPCSGAGNYLKIGFDAIAPACFSQIRIETEYGFRDRWTVGAETGLNLKAMKTYKDDIGTAHKDNLGEVVEREGTFRPVFMETGIYMQYYLDKTFSGPFIRAGISHRDRDGTDCIAGIGYAIRIGRRFGCNMTYLIHPIRCVREKRMPSEGIRIGLSYIF